MQPGKHTHDNVEGLLKESFLDLDHESPENSELMDAVAASVFSKEWPVATNKDGKGTETATLTGRKWQHWIWYLSALVLIVGLSYGAWELYNSSKDSSPGKTHPESTGTAMLHHEVSPILPGKNTGPAASEVTISGATGNPSGSVEEAKPTVQLPNAPANAGKTDPGHITQVPAVVSSTSHTAHLTGSTSVKVQIHAAVDSLGHLNVTATPPPAISDTASVETIFTTRLSATEKAEHKSNKEKMLDEMAGMHFTDYSKIDVSDKNPDIAAAFYMKRTEVTMRQYKLFLNDLLISGQNKAYEMARPRPENVWNDPRDKNNKNFLLMYFRKSAYNDYPVVCVPVEGMELYCQWLKREIEAYYKRNNKTISLTVRLPYENEWKYAASDGKKNHRYGTYTGRLKSWLWYKGYLANFAESQAKFVAQDDTVIPVAKKGRQKNMVATHKLRQNMFTTKAGLYPTNYLLSDMSGNVSEVVVTKSDSNKKYHAIGGNWNSSRHFLRINGPDEFGASVGPSPYIGFRPVIMINN